MFTLASAHRLQREEWVSQWSIRTPVWCPPLAACLAEHGSLPDCRSVSVCSILCLPLLLLIQKFAFENMFSKGIASSSIPLHIPNGVLRKKR